MGTVRTDEFRKDAVRTALNSKDQKMIWGSFSLRTGFHANKFPMIRWPVGDCLQSP
jgi:hypothetical protein